jgi:hypothetical protein
MRAADFCSSTDSVTGTHRIVWRPRLFSSFTAMSCDTPVSLRSRDRCGRRFHDAVRALVARVCGRPGVFFPCSARTCAPPLTPLSPSLEPRVAISREMMLPDPAEIVSLPHVVKTYGAPRSEASPPTRRFLLRVAVRLLRAARDRRWRCHYYNDTWSHPRALETSSCTPARMPAHVPSTAVRLVGPLRRRSTRAPSRERLATFTQGAGMEGRASLSVSPFDGCSYSEGREETSRGAVSRCREEGMNPGSPLPDTPCRPHEHSLVRKTKDHRNMILVLGGPRSSAFGIGTVACGARVGSLGNPPREGRDPGERSRCLSFVPSEVV